MRYRTIVADPPWHVQTGRLAFAARQWKMDPRQKSRPLAYPTMSVEAIAALPVRDFVEDGAHLYLWTINRYVRDAYDIARAWGFRPSTLLVWSKTPIGGGLGGTYGISTEFVLFARRGTCAHKRREGRTCFQWKRARPHSTKPEAFREMVEQVSPGPYLELFARKQHLGWDTWGDEAFEHVELAS